MARTRFLSMTQASSKLDILLLKRITGLVALLPVGLAQQRATYSNKLKQNNPTRKIISILILTLFTTLVSAAEGP